jgi:glycosyltransferase involved in cell wall biosynthesis
MTPIYEDAMMHVIAKMQVPLSKADEQKRSQFFSDESIELSIVMPCLDEAETLETCIRKARGFLETHGVNGEIVIGDNGSTDDSQDIARRNGARVVDVKIRGYGAALHYATLAARGKYVVIGDSDDSYDFTNLGPFLEELRAGKDLVMGNRFLGGIRDGAMPWKNRYIGNPVLTGIGRLFFHCPSGDFHCGMRGFLRASYPKLDLRTTGMEYASEMVIKATLMGLKIAEVPTTLSPDGRSRPPHLRPWRDGWRHLIFMLLYSPRWLFLYPGMLLMNLGLALILWLWSGQRRLGPVVLDVHTMLYAAVFVLMGFQAIAFAMFTKVFAIAEGLLPEDPRLNRLFKYITLEVGVIVGLSLILAGLVGTVIALNDWARVSFGRLDPTQTLRRVIPSALALALGIQTLFSSFFLSLLGLRIRRMAKA